MNPSEHALLVLNAGSASLKAASYLLRANTGVERALAQQTGRISIETSSESSGSAGEHAQAMLDEATELLPAASAMPSIVAHRVVHGGDRPGPTGLTPEVLQELDALSPLAPMHQPSSLALVRASMRRWPTARQVAVFDTSWHQTMPKKHRAFPIPKHYYSRGVKRYGFHGLAFQSAMRHLDRIAPERAKGRVVLAHLGGGSSLCAVRDGRSVNTTMGLTPLGGVPMASRSGSLDPGVVLHLQRAFGLSLDEIEQMLWRDSGLKGLSGGTGDMRELLAASDANAKCAVDVYLVGIVQGIAQMAACIGGIDVLVFSGGIGVNATEIRARIVNEMAWLGLELDPDANQAGAAEISLPSARAKAFVLPIDEEKEIANTILVNALLP